MGESGDNNKIELKSNDLVEIIAEKLKNDLHSKAFKNQLTPVEFSASSDSNISRKLWAYRLYYNINDNIVRRGDIIKVKKDSGDKLFLVLTSDCHLNKFWKSNLGHLTVTTLSRVVTGALKEKLELNCSGSDLKSKKATSISNRIIDGPVPVILPSIPTEGIEFDYMLFPKEVTNIEIQKPSANIGEVRKSKLEYEMMSDYEKILTVSEPFITPLIQHIISNITGYGAPDFPNSLQKSINENFHAILN